MEFSNDRAFTHITALLDLSNIDADALATDPVINQARRLAKRSRSSLTIEGFLAADENAGPNGTASGNLFRSALAGVAHEMRSQHGLSVVTSIRTARFDVAQLAEDYADVPTDLLLLRKPTVVSPMGAIFGGLSTLIRQTDVPVWFVHAGSKPQLGVVAAVSGKPDQPSSELRALDFEVMDAARSVSAMFDAKLHMVKAAERDTPAQQVFGALVGAAPALMSPHTGYVRDEELDREKQALESFATAAGVQDEVTQISVRAGEVAEVVTGHAQALQAGLIVMGATNASRWQTLLFGGTAETALTLAPCDVLYVKQGNDDRAVPQSAFDLSTARKQADDDKLGVPVSLKHQPRQRRRSPIALMRNRDLARIDKVRVLRSWREQLRSAEAESELKPGGRQLAEVRRALVRLGALDHAA